MGEGNLTDVLQVGGATPPNNNSAERLRRSRRHRAGGRTQHRQQQPGWRCYRRLPAGWRRGHGKRRADPAGWQRQSAANSQTAQCRAPKTKQRSRSSVTAISAATARSQVRTTWRASCRRVPAIRHQHADQRWHATAAIVQVGSGNVGTNVQTNVDPTLAAIAQFGTGNGAVNTQTGSHQLLRGDRSGW